MTLNPQFLADKKGKKVAVQLSVKEYEYLIEELEMKEDIELSELLTLSRKNQDIFNKFAK